MITRRFTTLIALLLSLCSTLFAQAPATTSVAVASASISPVRIFPGDGSYTYAGCYNETTGVAGSGGERALNGGSMEGDDNLTPERCFFFCGGTQYAGLEYGRECWCAPYLSALSSKLDDAMCGLKCKGNSSELCGGALAIAVYNRTGSGNGSGKKNDGNGLSGMPFGAIVGAILGGMVGFWL